MSGVVLQNETDDEPGGFAPEFLEDVPSILLELGAIVIVVILAWISARVLMRLLSRRIAKRLERPSLTRVTLAAIRGGVYGFAFLVILRVMGLGLGDLVLSVTVISAVIGVILAPIVRSTISGVFLLADQPYEIGDMVELVDEGKRGFVDDITLRYTKIFTLDNTFLVVPNGEIRERDVLNYSAEDSRIRLSIDILVTYESAVDNARARIEDCARAVDGVISGGPGIRIGGARYPAGPHCLISKFDDNGVLLQLRYWANEPYRMQTIQSEVQTNIWEAFEEEEVEFAYPHSHMVFDETSGSLDISHPEESGAADGRPATDQPESGPESGNQ